MRRREIVGLLAAAVWPRLVRAQQPAKQHRMALVHSGLPVHELTEAVGPFWIRQFFGEIRQLGYIEGRNLVVERYSAEGQHDRFAELAREVVASRPDLIITNYNELVASFKAATSSIPIIGIVAEPVRSGLVTNLARPGGNLTGVSIDAGLEIYRKRLQILKELVPSLERVAFLASSQGEWDGVGGQQLRATGRQLSIA